MRKQVLLYFLVAFASTVGLAYAFCPCIVVAVGVIVIAHYFGIPDVVTGLWVGSALISTGIWTEDELKKYLRKKNKYEDYARHKKLAIHLSLVYGITLASAWLLWYFGYFSGLSVMFYGQRINALLFGTAIGIVLTLIASLANRELWRMGIKLRLQRTALIAVVLVVFSVLLWGFH
jgi:hypothetical protein